MADRTLIRGAAILSQDPNIGLLRTGDILIEDGRLAAVGPRVDASDVALVDGNGLIALPGMVDGHKHTWQTIFRATSGDATLAEFFGEAVPATAPQMTPDDVYASNLLGAIDALDAGVTTFVDWCHITLSPEHSRAALRALRDSGARAWFAHGAPQPTWSDKSLEHPADLRSIKEEEFASESDDDLVRLAMAARGPMFANLDITKRDFAFARELGIPISLHIDMPGFAGNDVVELYRMGALGPDVTYLHGNTLTDEEIKLALDAGGHFVDSSVCDVLMGIGNAITERLLRHGIRPGISPDTTVNNPTDLFWVMRALVLMERARAFDGTFRRDTQPEHSHLSAPQMLDLATRAGAEAVWLGDEIGSLTPGKRADVVLLRVSMNLQPLDDIETAVVYCADRGNVDTVIVDGRVMKRSGSFVGVDAARAVRLANEARDRVYEAAERHGYVPRWRSIGLEVAA
jgi:cytosine/adenosine deaminase-related metal-dependent hydrolase